VFSAIEKDTTVLQWLKLNSIDLADPRQRAWHASPAPRQHLASTSPADARQ
jgi:hypothetical protein